MRVVIIGAGVSGICVAAKLRQRGFTDFLILDGEKGVGGTWRTTRYPGAQIDTWFTAYRYSFAPRRHTVLREHASATDVCSYLEEVVAAESVAAHLVLNSWVTSCVFNDDSKRWRISTRRAIYHAEFVVAADGAAAVPHVPDIAGCDEFRGDIFHSSHWPRRLPIAGSDIAVIGTGASAIQLAPSLSSAGARVTVFQRTAAWVIPVPRVTKHLFILSHGTLIPEQLLRVAALAFYEIVALAMRAKFWRTVVEVALIMWMLVTIRDPALRRQLQPKYALGCKRLIVSSSWYGAVARGAVSIETAPIDHLIDNYIETTEGVSRRFDYIVFATGYDLGARWRRLKVIGRNGARLSTGVVDDEGAYLGILFTGFPNMFVMAGPNTGSAVQSNVVMIEAQAGYIANCIDIASSTGTRVEVPAEIRAAYMGEVRTRTLGDVFTIGGCTSWILNSRGHNTRVFPLSSTAYRRMTRHPVSEIFRSDGGRELKP